MNGFTFPERLSDGDGARRLTAEAAADGDVLRVDRPVKLAAVAPAAVVGQRSDDLSG